MSDISTVYDAIVAAMELLFPSASGYYRLQDGENVSNNPSGFLEQGYGIHYSNGAPDIQTYGTYFIDHTFTFSLTREVAKLDGDFSQIDTASKYLVEDIAKIVRKFYDQYEWNVPEMKLSQMGAISPIQTIEEERGSGLYKFIQVDIVFRTEENICST